MGEGNVSSKGFLLFFIRHDYGWRMKIPKQSGMGRAAASG